jgi:hypothetical protein
MALSIDYPLALFTSDLKNVILSGATLAPHASAGEDLSTGK